MKKKDNKSEGGGGWSLWGSRKRPPKANLGEEDNKMYFNKELGRWVERGKEDEAAQEATSAPPPKIAATAIAAPAARKAISQRYVLQNNLSVSSSASSLADALQSGTTTPSPFLVPGAPAAAPSGPKFFVPGQTGDGGDEAGSSAAAPAAPKFFLPGASSISQKSAGNLYAASSTSSLAKPKRGSAGGPSQDGTGDQAGLRPSDNGSMQNAWSMPNANSMGLDNATSMQDASMGQGSTQASASTWEQPAVSAADAAVDQPAAEQAEQPEATSQAGYGGYSAWGSGNVAQTDAPAYSNGHGHAWGGAERAAAADAAPEPDAAMPPPVPAHTIGKAAKTLQSKGKELLGAISSFVPNAPAIKLPGDLHTFIAYDAASGGDLDFDSVMHPGSTQKLDGPLPWELPDELKHSDQFISICSNWQKQNPGVEYSPDMLLAAISGAPPPLPSASAAPAAEGAEVPHMPAVSISDKPAHSTAHAWAVPAAPAEQAWHVAEQPRELPAAVVMPEEPVPAPQEAASAAGSRRSSAEAAAPAADGWEQPMVDPELLAAQASAGSVAQEPEQQASEAAVREVVGDAEGQAVEVQAAVDPEGSYPAAAEPGMSVEDSAVAVVAADAEGQAAVDGQQQAYDPSAYYGYYQQQGYEGYAAAGADGQAYDPEYYNSEEYRQWYAAWYAAQQQGGVAVATEGQMPVDVQAGDEAAAAAADGLVHRISAEYADGEMPTGSGPSLSMGMAPLVALSLQDERAAAAGVVEVSELVFQPYPSQDTPPLSPYPMPAAAEQQHHAEHAADEAVVAAVVADAIQAVVEADVAGAEMVEELAVVAVEAEAAAPAAARPVPALPAAAAAHAAVADAVRSHDYASPRNALVVSHLSNTLAFMQQLLQRVNDGLEVHPATLQEALQLVRLFETPEFSLASRTMRAMAAGGSVEPVTPAKPSQGHHDAVHTPARHALFAHPPLHNVSPTSDPSPASQRDGNSRRESHDDEREAVEAFASEGASGTPSWPSKLDMGADLSAHVAAMRAELEEAYAQRVAAVAAQAAAEKEAALAGQRAFFEQEMKKQNAEHAAAMSSALSAAEERHKAEQAATAATLVARAAVRAVSREATLEMHYREQLRKQAAEMGARFQEQLDAQADAHAHEVDALRTTLEAEYVDKLAAMRSELEAHYEGKLAAMAAELADAQERSASTQAELDELLLCLGQESSKVAALSDAMRDAGLDPDAIVGPIEAEYAAMELPGGEEEEGAGGFEQAEQALEEVC